MGVARVPLSRRQLNWSMRTQNLYGTTPAKWGWLLLFVGLFGVWAKGFPAPTPVDWIVIGVSALGGICVLWGLALGAARNRLLTSGALATGKIAGMKPTGARVNGVMVVEVTYSFQHEDGEARVTVTVPITVRLGVQAIDALAEYLIGLIREQARLRETAVADDPKTHPVLRELAQVKPLELLRRIVAEGWDTVLKSYAERAAVAIAAEVVSRAPRAQAVEEKALALSEEGTPSSFVGEHVGNLVDNTHANLAGRITTEHWAGQMAHGLLNGARDLAADQLRALCAPNAEPIFYHPRCPEKAMPASVLPFTVELTEQGQLRGGSFLGALAVSMLPTLTILIHGIIALVRCWPR
jgi:hypothetical protein